MSITRVGATKDYSNNWDNIFDGKRGSGATKKKKKGGASTKKKGAKKKGKTK